MNARPREPGDAPEIARRELAAKEIDEQRAVARAAPTRARRRRTPVERSRSSAITPAASPETPRRTRARAISAGGRAGGRRSAAPARSAASRLPDRSRRGSASTASLIQLGRRIARMRVDRGVALLVDVSLAQLRHDLLARLVEASHAGGRLPSSRITCQPNCDCTGCERSPGCSRGKARLRRTQDPSPSREKKPSAPAVLGRRRIVGDGLRERLPNVGARRDLCSRVGRQRERLLLECFARVEQDVGGAHLRRVVNVLLARRGTARVARASNCARRRSNSRRGAVFDARPSKPREEAIRLRVDERAAYSGASASFARAPARRATSARSCG